MASLRQVFISHETKHDGQVAHRIAQDLERMSVLSLDRLPESIRPGESWVEAIDRGWGKAAIW